jgi:ADP-ribosylglycohydrolase
MAVDVTRGRIRGSLLAGAVGDALGAPVEFWSLDQIRQKVGPAGVTSYLPAYGLKGGAITDDTQMTLFTAEGLIRALERGVHRGIVHVPSVVQRAYLRWLTTQGRPWPSNAHPRTGDEGWLVTVDGLHHLRAPGNTCLSALESGRAGTIADPVNDSKGCGGVMRVAPVGFSKVEDPFALAADCAALTHGHPSGYLAAGFLGALIASLFDGAPLGAALDTATRRLEEAPGCGETLDALRGARALAAAGRPTPEQLESLGGGWVAEEALAIAVCCALVAADLRDALLLAVNHSGDSDSTGSIVGNILGTIHGEAAMPEELLDGLELRDVITALADDFTDAFHGDGVGNSDGRMNEREQRLWERYPGS